MKRFGWALAFGAMMVTGAFGAPTKPADKPVLMEFSVVEQEADGSRRVVASPKVVTRPGKIAQVTVQGQDHGLDLKVVPRRLANGRIRLGVDCKSWRMTGQGKKSRRVKNETVVQKGKVVALTNKGDGRMTLELEVKEM